MTGKMLTILHLFLQVTSSCVSLYCINVYFTSAVASLNVGDPTASITTNPCWSKLHLTSAVPRL